MNEATARIRINALVTKAGWRFFPDANGPANISLEHGVAIRPTDLDALGDDFERTERGVVDFLLLDDRGFPLVVLEAKSEGKQPLVGKEQARRYARSLNCRFVMLSNGNLHYFWDLERGNPHLITAFPTPESVGACRKAVPNPQRLVDEPDGASSPAGPYQHLGADILATLKEETVGYEGMKIDRMMFDRFADTVRQDETVRLAVESGRWDQVVDYVNREVFDKLRKAAAVDRRLTLREILERVFDLIPRFKSKDELVEEEFDKFITQHEPPAPRALLAVKAYFKAYATSGQFRHIIDTREFAALSTNPAFSMAGLRQVPQDYRRCVPEYIKDYVSLNQFAA